MRLANIITSPLFLIPFRTTTRRFRHEMDSRERPKHSNVVVFQIFCVFHGARIRKSTSRTTTTTTTTATKWKWQQFISPGEVLEREYARARFPESFWASDTCVFSYTQSNTGRTTCASPLCTTRLELQQHVIVMEYNACFARMFAVFVEPVNAGPDTQTHTITGHTIVFCCGSASPLSPHAFRVALTPDATNTSASSSPT